MKQPEPIMVGVRYIGPKVRAFDNVAGSKKFWNGCGDVQDVTEEQAEKLCKHTGAWVMADGADPGLENLNNLQDEEKNDPEDDKPKTIMVGDKSLDDMTMEEMTEFAPTVDVKVNGRWKEPRLREAIRARCLELQAERADQ